MKRNGQRRRPLNADATLQTWPANFAPPASSHSHKPKLETKGFLERYAETQFRFSTELLPLLAAGRAKLQLFPAGPTHETRATYYGRARLIAGRTSEYWRSVHQATVELCDALAAEPNRQVRVWCFDCGDTAADFNYHVYEGVDPLAIFGCLRFRSVLMFPADHVTQDRLLVRAGAVEFYRRAGALVDPQGSIRVQCSANDGRSTITDAIAETARETDSLWLRFPVSISGDRDFMIKLLRSDET